jgi:glycosylphosphatidylinositol transamidase (GPIT) subunit GPI8
VRIDYQTHKDTVAEFQQLLPGLKAEDLPDDDRKSTRKPATRA